MSSDIHYREGDQSIIICESADHESNLELVAGESMSAIVRRSDRKYYYMMGIWLKNVDRSVRMVSIGENNSDLRLDFVGMCYADLVVDI